MFIIKVIFQTFATDEWGLYASFKVEIANITLSLQKVNRGKISNFLPVFFCKQ